MCIFVGKLLNSGKSINIKLIHYKLKLMKQLQTLLLCLLLPLTAFASAWDEAKYKQIEKVSGCLYLQTVHSTSRNTELH